MIQEIITAEFYDGKERQVRILLPDDYSQSARVYPVLYMFDGQNVFDPEDSTIGVSWGIRESLEYLIEENDVGPLVIAAFDHAEERRVEEYGPFDMQIQEMRIEGEGAIFSDFLIERLIPSLEERYPLRRDAAGRFVAGASMGGLITAYIAMKYPDKFSKFGIFSLCAWVSREAFFDFLEQAATPAGQQFYVQVGKKEGLDPQTGQEDAEFSQIVLEDTLGFVNKLEEKGLSPEQIALRVGEEDWHSEVCWRRYVPDFLCWLQNQPNADSSATLPKKREDSE